MAIEAAEVLITGDDTLISKPKITRVEVTRQFDDEAFVYDENTAVLVWAEYKYLAGGAGEVQTDVQWREYLLVGDNPVPQNVVAYHEARIADAVYNAGPTNLAAFYGTEPTLPTEPA